MAAEDDPIYENIRAPELLGPVHGQRVVDITQHTREEWEVTREARIYLHFENGYTVSFPIGDAGFDIEPPDV